jgi:hypothetical protein
MFSKKEKRIITISLLICILLSAINLFGQDTKPGAPAQEPTADSLRTVIQDKLYFYQSELKKNTEVIETLQKELEQRRALNERLNGAIAAGQELLQVFNQQPACRSGRSSAGSLPDEASAKSGRQPGQKGK